MHSWANRGRSSVWFSRNYLTLKVIRREFCAVHDVEYTKSTAQRSQSTRLWCSKFPIYILYSKPLVSRLVLAMEVVVLNRSGLLVQNFFVGVAPSGHCFNLASIFCIRTDLFTHQRITDGKSVLWKSGYRLCPLCVSLESPWTNENCPSNVFLDARTDHIKPQRLPSL